MFCVSGTALCVPLFQAPLAHPLTRSTSGAIPFSRRCQHSKCVHSFQATCLSLSYDSHDHTLFASFGFLYISFVQLASVWRTCSVGMRSRVGNGGFHLCSSLKKAHGSRRPGSVVQKAQFKQTAQATTVVRSTKPANYTCILCVTSELRCINLINTIVT